MINWLEGSRAIVFVINIDAFTYLIEIEVFEGKG